MALRCESRQVRDRAVVSTTAGDRHLCGDGQPARRPWSAQSCRGEDRGEAAAGYGCFPDVLFPEHAPEMIKRLNHLDLAALPAESLSVRTELDRALLVVEPALRAAGHRIHFAGDVLGVLLNVRDWNEELATPAGQTA
jgi:hypothetical protein